MTKKLLTIEDIENMPDQFPQVNNTRDIQIILNSLPDDLHAYSIELTDTEFTVLVDSKGNAQRVPSQTSRLLVFYVEVPFSS
jgi:hypothetical protein